MAAWAGRLAGVRHRSLLGAGALPHLRHRGLPRGPEDEWHHAGHRPRHPPPDSGALYLPPPLPRRGHGAAGRCGGLRRADADRHPRHPGSRHHRQHRGGGAHLHLAAADAGGPLLCGGGPQGGRASAQDRHPRRRQSGLRQTLGTAGSLHRAQVGHSGGDPRPGDGHRRLPGEPAAQDWRSGQRRPRASRGFALQQGQRLHHQPLRPLQRSLCGDDQDGARGVPRLPDPDPGGSPGVGAATASRRAGHQLPGQCGAPDHRRHL
ncbi:hypothetical protein D3C81_1187160 [compost metagenome]